MVSDMFGNTISVGDVVVSEGRIYKIVKLDVRVTFNQKRGCKEDMIVASGIYYSISDNSFTTMFEYEFQPEYCMLLNSLVQNQQRILCAK